MFGKIKKLSRGSKGMEALQAVLLIGGAFVVVWGLMALWNTTKEPLQKEVQRVSMGGEQGGGAAATGTPGAPGATSGTPSGPVATR